LERKAWEPLNTPNSKEREAEIKKRLLADIDAQEAKRMIEESKAIKDRVNPGGLKPRK
jgi:hypothetical protein